MPRHPFCQGVHTIVMNPLVRGCLVPHHFLELGPGSFRLLLISQGGEGGVGGEEPDRGLQGGGQGAREGLQGGGQGPRERQQGGGHHTRSVASQGV